MRSVKVICPATVANLVCGFDVLGMCLDVPFDIMYMTLLEERKIIIQSSSGFDLPRDPAMNTAGAPLIEMMKEYKEQVGFKITIEKNIKPGSGIGSSAASAAGAVVGANHLLGNIFTKSDLVRFAMHGEKVASGVKHADNIAPCIFGGITIIRCIHPLDIITVSPPPLFVTIVHPQIEVRTSDARDILKKQVTLTAAIRQWGNIAGLVAGLLKNDYDLIGRSLEDVIIEPVRSILIPGFETIKKRSLDAGALGGGISGSGPSVFMLSKDEVTARKVEQAMKEIYAGIGLHNNTYVTTVNHAGVKVFDN